MNEPLSNARFRVEIDGLEATGACQVTLPHARILASSTRALPAVEFDTLVLCRGLTGSTTWYRWWDEQRRSKRKVARTVTVTLLDAAGAPQLGWRYTGARPSGYAVSGLDAMASGVLIETLEVTVAGFEASFTPPETPPAMESPARKAPAPSK